MRIILAQIFRFLFQFSFFRKRYFGIHQRIIFPKKLFRGVKRKYLFDDSLNFELHIEDWIQQNLYFLGEYENTELTFVKNHLKKGDYVIDIGANIGLYALFCSKYVGQEGKVYAFEALPKNFNLFQKNVALNSVKNVQLENLAIFNTQGTLEIFTNTEEANQGMASSYMKDFSEKISIPALTLDAYVEEHKIEKIDFIKMDIEGGEFPALQGMRNTLQKFKPTLLLEVDAEILKNTPFTEEEILNFLAKLNYSKYFLTEKGELSEKDTFRNSKNYIFKSN